VRTNAAANVKPRRLGKASIATLLGLIALVGGLQGLSPASAAAETAEEPCQGDSRYFFNPDTGACELIVGNTEPTILVKDTPLYEPPPCVYTSSCLPPKLGTSGTRVVEARESPTHQRGARQQTTGNRSKAPQEPATLTHKQCQEIRQASMASKVIAPFNDELRKVEDQMRRMQSPNDPEGASIFRANSRYFRLKEISNDLFNARMHLEKQNYVQNREMIALLKLFYDVVAAEMHSFGKVVASHNLQVSDLGEMLSSLQKTSWKAQEDARQQCAALYPGQWHGGR
jgi:hypothetical protein